MAIIRGLTGEATLSLQGAAGDVAISQDEIASLRSQ